MTAKFIVQISNIPPYYSRCLTVINFISALLGELRSQSLIGSLSLARSLTTLIASREPRTHISKRKCRDNKGTGNVCDEHTIRDKLKQNLNHLFESLLTYPTIYRANHLYGACCASITRGNSIESFVFVKRSPHNKRIKLNLASENWERN